MANTYINPSIVAKEALRQLENNCVMARLVHRGYEEEWQRESRGWKVGNSITLKTPVYFRVKDGATLDDVELREEDTSFTLSYRKHVAWAVTSEQMTYSQDKFSKRFIKPAMQALGNYIDTVLLGLYTDIPNQVGTPGTTPSSFLTFAQAQARLEEEACPPDDRYCVINPTAQAYLADHLKGLFHQQMVGDAIRKGQLPSLAGFGMYMSQNVNTHTCGTWAGSSAVLVDDTVADGDATINLDQNGAGSALTVKHGDIFTIANVNAVNPISGISTGSVRNFVVDADATFADAGGGDYNLDITCTPGTDPYFLIQAGAAEKILPYQTVDTLPANDAAVTIPGSSGLVYPVNLAFHRHCLSLAMVPLEMPASVAWGAQESYNGFSIRVVRDYDVTNDKEYVRFDVLFGIKAINPRLGCRIAG